MFFKHNDNASLKSNSDCSLSDSSESSFERINNYLNDVSTENPYDESIFIFVKN